MAHGDSVRNGNRYEFERDPTVFANGHLGALSQTIEWQVAGSHFVPRRGHADLRQGHVFVAKTHGPKHCASRGAVLPLGYD